MVIQIHDAKELRGKTSLEVVLGYEDFSLFKFQGEDSQSAVLVSGILHGCEPCGLNAILDEINSDRYYNKDVYFLLGNLGAAGMSPYFSNRIVPGGQNFNRIWTTSPLTENEFQAHSTYSLLKNLPLEGHLDIHSFTSKSNPKHIFIGDLNESLVDLASIFGNYVFHCEADDGLLLDRMKSVCPSLIVECGTNGSSQADDNARNSLRLFLEYFGVTNEGINLQRNDVSLYTDEINVKITSGTNIEFGSNPIVGSLVLREDIESLNIQDCDIKTHIGYCDSLDSFSFRDHRGEFIFADQYFIIQDSAIYVKRPLTFNLLAKDPRILKESGFYVSSRVLVSN